MKLTDADIQTLLNAVTYYINNDEPALSYEDLRRGSELAERLRHVITYGPNGHYVE